MLESFLALSRILTGSTTWIRSLGAGKDVRIILSQFQLPKGGLEALQAAGLNLNNVKIQNKVHNKGFIFDHK
jgi:hypothetical protein